MLRYVSILLLPLAAVAGDPTFAGGLYPVLQKANCHGCHTDNGIASATRLHFPQDDASSRANRSLWPQPVAAYWIATGPRTRCSILKPTNRVKHTGGKLIPPGSPERDAAARLGTLLAKAPRGIRRDARAGCQCVEACRGRDAAVNT